MTMIKKNKNLIFDGIDINSSKEEIVSDNTSVVQLIDGLNNIYFEVIYVNPNIYLAHRGARICIGQGPMIESFREKSKYVSKVLARQHESILEHTNIIVLVHINKSILNKHIEDYTELFSSLKYCNIISKSKDTEVILLIGGSIRAFIHALRETRKDNYFILNMWKPIIYSTIEKDFLRNLFKDNLLEEDKCTYITDSIKFDETLENYNITKVDIPEEKEYGNTVTLIFKNNLLNIYEKVKQYFTIKEISKIATLSFVFHDISRSCSHQLVRHRNGISQESQRYFTKEYKYEEDFVNPIYLEKERYKDLDIDNLLDFTGTFDNYNELISLGIHKEDARAWLPTNVKTKLMMTFTYENFCKFLKLRLDKHAQTEIRLLALCAASVISQDIIDINLRIKFSEKNNDLIMDFIDYICKYNSLISVENEIEEIDEEINSLDISTEEQAENILKTSERYDKLTD